MIENGVNITLPSLPSAAIKSAHSVVDSNDFSALSTAEAQARYLLVFGWVVKALSKKLLVDASELCPEKLNYSNSKTQKGNLPPAEDDIKLVDDCFSHSADNNCTKIVNKANRTATSKV